MMRYISVITLLVLSILFPGCRSGENKQATPPCPANLAEAVNWDWQRNAELEISAVETMSREEALTRRRYHEADARLAGFTGKESYRMSNDPCIPALDNAAACAAVMLDAKAAEKAAKWRRYDAAVRNCVYFAYYRKLEQTGVISFQEREDCRYFMLNFEVEQGIEPRRFAGVFDFSSLRSGDEKNYQSALPEWMSWSEKTPLLWTKLLLTLPQETARTVDLDHSKLADKVLEISRAVKAATACSHVRKLCRNTIPSGEYRLQAERELDLRLAAGAMSGVSERTPGTSREEEFIRDLYILQR